MQREKVNDLKTTLLINYRQYYKSVHPNTDKSVQKAKARAYYLSHREAIIARTSAYQKLKRKEK